MKSEVDEIIEALGTLYGESVVSTNLSAHQAAADRLSERIYHALKFGRLRLADARMIVVPIRDFEHFGATQYAQDCSHCRYVIKKGEPVWFRTNRHGERTMAFHESCFEDLRIGMKQGALFDAMKADGLA